MKDVLSPQVPCVVRFSRGPDDNEQIEVDRPGRDRVQWTLPGHASRLPHDLCHLVVEDVLEIDYGFWGLVSRGVEVRLVDDHAELVYDGKPLREHVGTDFSELERCEEAVAILGSMGTRTEQIGALVVVRLDDEEPTGPLQQKESERIQSLFPGRPAELITRVRTELIALRRQWLALAAGASITLRFPGATHHRPDHLTEASGEAV